MVDRTVPRPEYPRPQLRRQDWTNLNGEWSIAFDDPDAGLANGWQNTDVATLRSNDSPFDRKIIVPFCYQSNLSSIGDTAFHDVVWYARTFEYAPADDERLLLHLGAVDYRATIWVNGTQVASHEGGHTPFSADVTYALTGEARDNIVIVRTGRILQESKIRQPDVRPASSTTSGCIGRRGELVGTYRARRMPLQEKSEPQKERETKEDGRYIIFYTFEEEEN